MVQGPLGPTESLGGQNYIRNNAGMSLRFPFSGPRQVWDHSRLNQIRHEHAARCHICKNVNDPTVHTLHWSVLENMATAHVIDFSREFLIILKGSQLEFLK